MAGRALRPRPRRVIVPVLILAVLAAAVAVLEAAESPSWLAWLPAWAAAAIAAALGVLVLWWAEPVATRRADPLIDLLTREGHVEEAERLRRFGFNPDGSIATGPGDPGRRAH